MILENINWNELSLRDEFHLKGEVFSIIQWASLRIQAAEHDDPILLSVVPRLADLMSKRAELSSFREMFSALARSVGLLNYINRSYASASEQIAAERATIPNLGITLHKEQIIALKALVDGRNLILSAPTSFGKSILIDALLLNDRFRRVAIVLPTIALLDEFRRRLVKRFGDRFDILMHHSEKSARDRIVFLGTQERLINRKDLGFLDLVVVDEFYKLDPNRQDDRSATLNAAVYKLLNVARQFFFLGPNIDKVISAQNSRWDFKFLKTRFSTVAVDAIDLKEVEDKDARLFQEVARKSNWPALVFVSAPDRANQMARDMVEGGVKLANGSLLSQWMAENYGRQWALSKAVAVGIGVHHGKIPRALASRFVTLFNQRKIPLLICTSTLIEGVNTAAKSVLIYDKSIKSRPYDFFTYSNIKGRAGRLGQHHVGQVYLFHEPPDQKDVEVSAPLFSDPDSAPDEFVVHMDTDDVTESVNERIFQIADRVGLEAETLRRFSTLGISNLISLRSAVKEALRTNDSLLWSAMPSYENIWAGCRVICSVKNVQSFGCKSPKQMAHFINRLRRSKTMKGFYKWYSGTYLGDEQIIDNIFKFLRSLEFSLVEYFAVLEVLVKQFRPEYQVDYSLLLAEMPRWFRPEPLKIVEERGVPIQISERFFRTEDTVMSLEDKLRFAAMNDKAPLTPMERQWIKDALP